MSADLYHHGRGRFWRAKRPLAGDSWLAAGILVFALASPAAGQQDGPCSRTSVTRALADTFAAVYVLPRTAAQGAGQLRGLLSEDRFATGSGAQGELATQLTQALRSSTGDGHITVEWIPPSGPPAEEADWIARWKAGAPRANHGIPRVEVLPGNIGYIALRSFHTYIDAAPTLRAAMTLVRHTEGLILDLRGNGGGDDDTARALTQTFLAPGADWPLQTESRRGIDAPAPPPPLQWELYGTQRPLAVLIDDRSFSAPEAVAFVLATSGRAVVIGSRSAGGAHMIEKASPLPCGFRAWIPTRRPFHATTGGNWEGTGVAPDVDAAGEAVLGTAHLHMLRMIHDRSTNPEARAELIRLIAELERERNPAPQE
jgi:carboxyl-terminal processing protease